MKKYLKELMKRFLNWLHEKISKNPIDVHKEPTSSLRVPKTISLGDVLVKDGIIYAICKIRDDNCVECFMHESIFNLDAKSGAITGGPIKIFTMEEIIEIFNSEEYKNAFEDFKENYIPKYRPIENEDK